MKAQDLKLNELVDITEGRLNIKGRDFVLHPKNAFAQVRKDIVDNIGIEEAHRIFTRFGYFHGHSDADSMKDIFNWDNDEEFIKASLQLMDIQGRAKYKIDNFDYHEPSSSINMEITLFNSKEADEHLYQLGESEAPVCWMLTGYLSGYISFCLEKDVYFKESKCKGKGDEVCKLTGKDKNSWGNEITPTLKHFKSLSELQSKVQELSRKLRKMKKKARHDSGDIKLDDSYRKNLFVEVRSKAYKKVLKIAHKVAQYDSTLLVTGETGAGKEVLAKYIHSNSHRSEGPFTVVNCSALPENLLESELFGHKKGAFTGAHEDRIGLFEKANQGTVFLDEIGDISEKMQIKLLRVLQEHEITRLGENEPREVDIRVIAATNRNLEKLIEQNEFREDLYYRLKIVKIEVPPLRDRNEDIIPLSRHLVDKISEELEIDSLTLDATSLDYLQTYNWPGNVRELENAIEGAAVLCENNTIKPRDLRRVINVDSFNLWDKQDRELTLDELEKEYIDYILDKTEGNKSEAAEILGIDPSTLWRKLKE